MKAAAITLTNVTKRFGSHVALDSVSLEVPPGTADVVLGPSGCGKTTMLRIIAGLEVPDSGQVALDGATVVSAPFASMVVKRYITVRTRAPWISPARVRAL